MLGGAAGQDERLARGNGLVHQKRGVDLLFGAGKGKNDLCALVLVQREQMAADGLGALGLVSRVKRALLLADEGAQRLLFFDHRHGSIPPDVQKFYFYRSKKRGKTQGAEESKSIPFCRFRKEIDSFF